MGLIKEFRDFAMKGNVIDLAVGVVIGAAFQKIVSSLVENIIMPPLNLLTEQSKINFNEMVFKYPPETGPVYFKYGAFIQSIVDFLIVAVSIFLAIKFINMAKARFETQKEEKPPVIPEDVLLLREIRDALKK
jgi:large conductance mechanosensitive channel